MLMLHPQYITDSAGQKLVVLPISEFDTIIEELEELEDIRICDEAKSSAELSVPIDAAFKEIEEKRKKH